MSADTTLPSPLRSPEEPRLSVVMATSDWTTIGQYREWFLFGRLLRAMTIMKAERGTTDTWE